MYTLYDRMFKRQREKLLKDYRLIENWLTCNQICMSKFIYNDLPETIPQEWIEGILISNGTAGIGEYNDKLYVVAGSYCGNINGYLPDRYVGAIQGIGTIEGNAEGTATNDELRVDLSIGNEIVVGWNNATLSSDLDIIDTASRLTECDTSEDLNILFSRLLRIPIAKDDKEKEVILSAIRSILEGKIDAVSSKIGLDEVITGNASEQKFLDLVDVKDVDKLQYLNQYHDNIMKRFFNRHGHSMQITSKIAQQSRDEIHGTDSISMIYPVQQLHYRQKFCDDLNRVFGEKYGFNCSVEFSPLWKNQYDSIVNYMKDETNEEGIIEDDMKEGAEDEKDIDSGEGNTSNTD